MRAVVAHAFGAPETFVIEEKPAPEPGAGQVRIAVRAVGVSFVDVLIAAGGYQIKPPLPFTPGTEFAGVVEAVGEGVSDLAPGDRVAASGMGGGLSQQAVLAASTPVKLPDGMSFAEGSVFRVSYATAYHALVQRARLAPGETVLVLGAGGAVGVAAIQLAKALGARVIGSASSEAKRALALEAGAEAAVDSGAADWRDQIKALTSGRGVDVVVDPVGGAATELAFRSLAWKGRHLVIGFAAGEIPRLPVNLPLLKGADLVGVDIRQFGLNEPQVAAANLAALFELYAKGAIRPKIAETYPFERFAEAMQAAHAGRAAGRIVVEIGG
ncbi:MAG: NADPH:quinone oxidoreductase family protein [Phenylobacterium sp.]|nr:NADPH:quinone oxidoreductase family protein [Phenylobacterium sp.]